MELGEGFFQNPPLPPPNLKRSNRSGRLVGGLSPQSSGEELVTHMGKGGQPVLNLFAQCSVAMGPQHPTDPGLSSLGQLGCNYWLVIK